MRVEVEGNASEKIMKECKEKFEELLSTIEKEEGEPIKTDLNIILILIPIPSKKDLIKMLHQKLYNQQNA